LSAIIRKAADTLVVEVADKLADYILNGRPELR
jgi:hypothetical protein